MVQRVNFLHNHNIAHGDIKPSNFIMMSSGEVKMIDFESCLKIDQLEPN
jgi:serine/threonine protein kinase